MLEDLKAYIRKVDAEGLRLLPLCTETQHVVRAHRNLKGRLQARELKLLLGYTRTTNPRCQKIIEQKIKLAQPAQLAVQNRRNP